MKSQSAEAKARGRLMSHDEELARLRRENEQLKGRIQAWEAVFDLSRGELLEAKALITAQEQVMHLSRTELKVLRSDIDRLVGGEGELETEILNILKRAHVTGAQRFEMLQELHERHGAQFCTDALRVMANIVRPPHEAQRLWRGICEQKRGLTLMLGREVGLGMALIDYLQNLTGILDSPKVMEVSVFSDLIRHSVVDELTGLYNRRFLTKTVDRDLAQAARHDSPVAVIVCDIDHFKRINDTYGHPVGDEVLLSVAGVLSEESRSGDAACRMGGEEFLVLAPDLDASGAFEVAERMRHAVSRQQFRFREPVTMSFGVAAFPDFKPDFDELLLAADQALYTAKRGGRNQTVLARPSA